MKYAGKLRKILNSSIDHICEQRDKYFVSPDKNFIRKGKFTPQDIFKSLLTMEGAALSHELLSYFNFNVDAPTKSAFVQSRAKIKPVAFEDLFYDFVSSTHESSLYKGYRLLAADGSHIHIPTNPKDAESFLSPKKDSKPYNLLHLNALFDLLTGTYTDIVIQKARCQNEHSAFVSMIKKHSTDHDPVIFTADRGFESYNSMAHISESGNKFLIRIRDSDYGSIVSGLALPEGEFDCSFVFKLVRKQTKEVKEMMKTDKLLKYIASSSPFDFLPSKRKRNDPVTIHELPIRLVRFKITDDSYELVATNLPDDDFPPDELKHIYAMRWGIETSFRDLKYTVGLLHFHAKKTESILQEIFARLIMYNFSQLITSHVIVEKKERKYSYRVNFSQAVLISRNFLLRRIPPSNVEALISAHILPIRYGKHNPRAHSSKHALYFIYRIA